LVVTPCSDAAG